MLNILQTSLRFQGGKAKRNHSPLCTLKPNSKGEKKAKRISRQREQNNRGSALVGWQNREGNFLKERTELEDHRGRGGVPSCLYRKSSRYYSFITVIGKEGSGKRGPRKSAKVGYAPFSLNAEREKRGRAGHWRYCLGNRKVFNKRKGRSELQ